MERRGWQDAAPLPLRLVLGFGFAWHGYPKLFAEGGHAGFVGALQGMGVPAPDVFAWAVGILEFFGGIALILGAFTVLVSALAVLEMLYAAFAVHVANGFDVVNIVGQTETGPMFGMPGYEYNLLYIAGFMALILGGAGALSIDRLRHGREEEPVTGQLPVEPTETTVPDRAWTGDEPEMHERQEEQLSRR